jgi:hypothetical protein
MPIVPRRIVLFAALLANFAIAGVVAALAGGRSVAEAWYALDANSLVGFQALVEQRLDPNPGDPTLYFDVVLPVLETPLWLAVLVVLIVLDLVPLALVMRRTRRGGEPTVERKE